MLRLAIGFFVLALVAAVFGFGGFAGGFATIAMWLFGGFLLLAVVGLVAGMVKRA